MSFRITGLSPEPFRPLFGLSDQELAAQGVRRYVADSKPGFPDRVEVRDAEPGETVLLLNYTHQPADTPYRASHAIFVIEGAQVRYDRIDEIPSALRLRTLSLRAFDKYDLIVDADLVDGGNVESAIQRFFAAPRVAYIHAHYAKYGCYAARIDRLS
jgi:Protein of unknown function (DUF1203)